MTAIFGGRYMMRRTGTPRSGAPRLVFFARLRKDAMMSRDGP